MNSFSVVVTMLSVVVRVVEAGGVDSMLVAPWLVGMVVTSSVGGMTFGVVDFSSGSEIPIPGFVTLSVVARVKGFVGVVKMKPGEGVDTVVL